MEGHPGFCDVDEPHATLSSAGDSLELLSAASDSEIFQLVLYAARARSNRSLGSRPRYDAVLMFHLLVLQALYSLSDEQPETQFPG